MMHMQRWHGQPNFSVQCCVAMPDQSGISIDLGPFVV